MAPGEDNVVYLPHSFAKDLEAVTRDDELLDALGGDNPPKADPNDEAQALLLAWRRDIDAEPLAELTEAS